MKKTKQKLTEITYKFSISTVQVEFGKIIKIEAYGGQRAVCLQ